MNKLSSRVTKIEGKLMSEGPGIIVGSSREEIDKKIEEARLIHPGYKPPLVIFIRRFSGEDAEF